MFPGHDDRDQRRVDPLGETFQSGQGVFVRHELAVRWRRSVIDLSLYSQHHVQGRIEKPLGHTFPPMQGRCRDCRLVPVLINVRGNVPISREDAKRHFVSAVAPAGSAPPDYVGDAEPYAVSVVNRLDVLRLPVGIVASQVDAQIVVVVGEKLGKRRARIVQEMLFVVDELPRTRVIGFELLGLWLPKQLPFSQRDQQVGGASVVVAVRDDDEGELYVCHVHRRGLCQRQGPVSQLAVAGTPYSYLRVQTETAYVFVVYKCARVFALVSSLNAVALRLVREDLAKPSLLVDVEDEVLRA